MAIQPQNWGSGETLSDALLQGVQGQQAHPNIPPLESPDRSLVNEFLQNPAPASPALRRGWS